MNRIYRKTFPFLMASSKVSQELGKSACMLLCPGIAKELAKIRVTPDLLEHSKSDLYNLFIPPNFLLHRQLTASWGLLLLTDIKLLCLIFDHDHVSELLEHVDHFSKTVDL